MVSRSTVKESDPEFTPVAQEGGLTAGRHFLFVEDGGGISPELAQFVQLQGGARAFPLWNSHHEIGLLKIEGPTLGGLSLQSVSTDKDVYQEETDEVTILVVDPDRRDRPVRPRGDASRSIQGPRPKAAAPHAG